MTAIKAGYNFDYLNTPVADEETTQEWLLGTRKDQKPSKIQQCKELLDHCRALSDAGFPYEAHQLLKWSFSGARVQHLQRVIEPRILAQFLVKFNE